MCIRDRFEYELASKTSLVGGLYYQQGFTDITRDDGSFIDTEGNPRSENSKGTIGSVILRLGIMF